MAEWLRGLYPAASRKIVVVENGVDPSFLEVCDTRRARPPHAVPILVCAGNLIPRKGHSVLLRALARCTIDPWKLQLAGEGSERAELVRLAGELEDVYKRQLYARTIRADVPLDLRMLAVAVPFILLALLAPINAAFSDS